MRDHSLQSIIGRVLLWTGFLIGAIATVSWLDPGWQPPGQKLESADPGDATPDDAEKRANTAQPLASDGERAAATSKSPWWTIPWWTYGGGLVVGIVGSVLIHRSKRSDRLLRRADANRLPELRNRIHDLVAELSTLDDAIAELKPAQVLNILEEKCQVSFNEFMEHRLAMIDHFGMTAYARVMSEIASAERFANRAWSAAVDGYMDEVATSVKRAAAHIRLAAQLFAECDQR